MAAGDAHPMELKKRLAREIVTRFHSAAAADAAAAAFERVVQKRQVPADIPATTIDREVLLRNLLRFTNTVSSASEAARLIQQGAVEVDGRRVTDPGFVLRPDDLPPGGIVIQAGKRRFLRVERG
jgi:tyrosyl-tRNA synthetase